MNTVPTPMSHGNNISKSIEILEDRFGQPKFVLDSLPKKAKLWAVPSLNKPETIIEFGIAVRALVIQEKKKNISILSNYLLESSKKNSWRLYDPKKKSNKNTKNQHFGVTTTNDPRNKKDEGCNVTGHSI